ncbi:B3/B4 domain-containing protein, partial [Klebsiella aerogenes]|uniref:B3/B4 domain-containing protein n=1 Tax=Klebsiella aerogenes TaxID=548 RepID=UPI0021E119AA
MSHPLPSISPQLAGIAPGFRALSITVNAAPLSDASIGEAALASACQAVLAGEPAWAEDHLAAWSTVFKAFGAKPKRTPCSAEALRKRVLRDGAMPAIDPVVDLYNAVSLRYAIPVGDDQTRRAAIGGDVLAADGNGI